MLKAGFARVEATPPLGTFVPGAYANRFSEGVLDPIYVNALALSVGERRVLLVAADFLSIEEKYAKVLRARISARTGVPEGDIFITALHQHTAIALRGTSEDNNLMGNEKFLAVLYQRFDEVCAAAIDDLRDAVLSVAERETAEKIAFIRRYRMKDGSVVTNPIGRGEEIAYPLCDADNTVRLLRFQRAGARDIALVNFSTHPDLIHKPVTSADWPGFVRTYMESALAGDIHCLVTVGVQGDSNHCNFFLENYPDGYEHAKHMARVITDAALSVWDNTEDVPVDAIDCKRDTVYNEPRTDGKERYDEMKAILQDPEAAIKNDPTYETVARAKRIVTLCEKGAFVRPVPVSVITLGRVAIVGFGGEPFTSYAKRLRAARPDLFLLTSCNANGSAGYLPSRATFAEGGYEEASTVFSPSLEDECCSMALSLLNE